MQITRLRYFVAHVQRTIERMEQAKTGQHRFTLEQLDMLDVREYFYRLSRMLKDERGCAVYSDSASSSKETNI